MRFEKGYIPWMKGKHHTEEAKKIIREKRKHQIFSKESIEKRKQSRSWYRHSDETRQKISMALKGKNKGIHHSPSTEFKKGEIPWMRNKHHTDETKQKLSLTNKGKHYSPETEFKKGSKLTLEVRQKMSESHKRWYQNPEFKEKHRLSLNRPEIKAKSREATLKYFREHPEAKQRLREFRLNQDLPKKNTVIELAIREGLKKENIEFEPEKKMFGITKVDAFIKPNICVYADGCWWHLCEKCFDKNTFLNSEVGRDILKKKITDDLITVKLIKEGYIVLRFWEHEIKNNLPDVINRIKEAMEVEINAR